MAVNPIQFLVAQNASITDGTKTITISGNVDCSRVFSGTAVFLGGADNPAEAIAGTAPDGSGNSTITLRNNWSQGDVINQQLVSFNTNEGLAEAISNVREIVSNVSAIEDLATQGLIKRISDNVYEVVNISTIGESLITASDASSQRSVLGLGSAATKNITTGLLDTTSGRLLQVGDFGVTGNGTPPTLTDLDSTTTSAGNYLITSSGTIGTRPSGFSSFGVCIVTRYTSSELFQKYIDINGRVAYRDNVGGVFSNWLELYHSGNSVNPLEYGLGGNVSNFLSANPDMLADLKTGFYRTFSSTTGMQSTSGDTVIASRYDSNNNGRRLLLERDSIRFKSQNTDGTWLEEQELYHTGNTNFNEFGRTDTSLTRSLIATGNAISSTVAEFYIPINSRIHPTSVSIIGELAVRNIQDSASYGTTTSASLNVRSTTKMAIVSVSSLSGMTQGEPVKLMVATYQDKMTINF